MNSSVATSWKVLRPLGTALFVLVLLNIGLYSILPPPRGSLIVDRPRSIRFDFDERPPGEGWYTPESTGSGTTFAWTSNVDATLSLSVSPRDPLEIIFRIINGKADNIDGLTLTANQSAIPLDHSGDQFSGVIPQAVLDAHPASLNLTFHTPKVYRPSDGNPDSSDTRSLGVAFDWLIVRPHADNSTLYEFDQGCTAANGWYGTEIDGSDGSTFCWSGSTDATLPIHIPRGKPFTLEAGIIEAISPDVLASFRLKINDTVLQSTQETHASRLIYSANVAPIDADEAVVTFHVDQLGTPALDNDDQRTLGLRVDWLRITEKPS